MVYGKLEIYIKKYQSVTKNYFNTLRGRSNVVVILDEKDKLCVRCVLQIIIFAKKTLQIISLE